MKYIIFDLEFNQFFKFNNNDVVNPNLVNEIIQIGAIKLDENLIEIGKLEILIKPVVYPKINPYVTKQTKIKTKDLSNGLPFSEAIKRFNSWVKKEKDFVICSWGTDDVPALVENCTFFEIERLIINKYIDVQNLYQNYSNSKNLPGLFNAVEALNISQEYPFHTAFNDAHYTTSVFRIVYDRFGESIINWEEIRIMREKNREINKTLKEKLQYKLTKIIIRCPKCGRFMRKNKTNFGFDGSYLAYSFCNRCQLNTTHVARIKKSNGSYTIKVKSFVNDTRIT